jgi:hypothetical protein
MVFPLAFFAVEGFRRFRFGRLRRVLGGGLVFLSFCFVLLPAGWAFPYFRVFPYYVPSSMLQNTVALGDCGDVVSALGWVDGRVGSGGVLLVHDVFRGWALLYMRNVGSVVGYGYGDPAVAAAQLVAEGVGRVFVVWWVAGEGWHGVASLSGGFVEVFRSGRIAVYEYRVGV